MFFFIILAPDGPINYVAEKRNFFKRVRSKSLSDAN